MLLLLAFVLAPVSTPDRRLRSADAGVERIDAHARRRGNPEDVAEGLIGSLVEAFPGGLPVVSLVQEDGALRVRSPNVGRLGARPGGRRGAGPDRGCTPRSAGAASGSNESRCCTRCTGSRDGGCAGSTDFRSSNPAGDLIGSLALLTA